MERDGKRRRRDDMGITFPGPMRVDVCRGVQHHACRVADPPVPVPPAFAESSFAEQADARLEQLIRRDAEEIRDLVEICQLQFARALQKLVDRGRMYANRHGEGLLVFFPDPQQSFDILA